MAELIVGDVLALNPVLNGLRRRSPELFSELVLATGMRTLRRGEILLRHGEGDDRTSLIVVARGALLMSLPASALPVEVTGRLQVRSVDSEAFMPIRLVLPGEVLGWSVVLSRESGVTNPVVHSADVWAREDEVAVCSVPGDLMRALARKDHVFVIEALAHLASALSRKDVERLCSYFIKETVTDRVEAWVLSLRMAAERAGKETETLNEIAGGAAVYQFMLEQEEIAGMVDASRARVTEALQVLKAKGLVDYSRGRLYVVAQPALPSSTATTNDTTGSSA